MGFFYFCLGLGFGGFWSFLLGFFLKSVCMSLFIKEAHLLEFTGVLLLVLLLLLLLLLLFSTHKTNNLGNSSLLCLVKIHPIIVIPLFWLIPKDKEEISLPIMKVLSSK